MAKVAEKSVQDDAHPVETEGENDKSSPVLLLISDTKTVAVIMTSSPICGNIVAVFLCFVIFGVVRPVRLAFTLPFYQWPLYSCPLLIYHGSEPSSRDSVIPQRFTAFLVFNWLQSQHSHSFSLLLGGYISSQSGSSAMDVQVISRVNERVFAGDRSIGPVFPFRQMIYARDCKQRNREPEPKRRKSVQYMVDRDDEHEEAGTESSTALLPEERGKPLSIIGPYHSEGGINRYTLRTYSTAGGDVSSTQNLVRESTQSGTISMSIDQQPPLEFRPGIRLPPIVVNIKRLRHQRGESWMGEEGSLWAQVSLMSADGQMAMALFAPDILAAEDMVTPLFREVSADSAEERWSLAFKDLRIRHSGYFKIHIAVLRSLQSEEQGDEDPAVEPPRELMGIDTQIIRVHAFAPS